MSPTVRLISLALLAAAAFAGMSAHAGGVGASDELMTAIRNGDHKRLAQVLRRNADPNTRLADGSLPIAWAIEQQDAHAVGLLLKHGARVDDHELTGNAFRPLIVACLNPSMDVLRRLLDTQPNVDVRGPDNIPALSLCSAHAPLAAVQRMLDDNAAPDETDDNGQTPLMWAAAHARPDTFSLLLDHGAEINRRSAGGFSPIMFAVKSGSAEMAAHVLAAGADARGTASDGTTLLQLAMYQSNYDFALQLIDAESDLASYDRNGRQLLHAAVIANQIELVRRLLDMGADVNAPTQPSKVSWRYESNFRAGAYEFPQLPPLLLAAQAGHGALIELLAERGATLDHRSAAGNNLLLAASGSNSPNALKVALDLSPDVNVTNDRGDTPLHRVLSSADSETLAIMLRLLADRGARTDIANARGQTADAIANDEHFKLKVAFAGLFE